MNPAPKTYPVRDLQRKYRSIIDTAKKTHDAIFLMKGGVPEAVLMDVDMYNRVIAGDDHLDTERVLKLVQQAENSYKAGKVKRLESWDELDD